MLRIPLVVEKRCRFLDILRMARRFETDELVLDKWFALQATVPRPETLETVMTRIGA